jgi:hypothetical protein
MAMGLAMIIVMVVMMVLMGGAIAWGALTGLRTRMRRKGGPDEAQAEPPPDKRHAAHRQTGTDEYGERDPALTGSARPRG